MDPPKRWWSSLATPSTASFTNEGVSWDRQGHSRMGETGFGRVAALAVNRGLEP